MGIEKFFDEMKYAGIVDYLKGNNILDVCQLKDFDYYSLYDIPGLSLDAAEEAIQKIEDYIENGIVNEEDDAPKELTEDIEVSVHEDNNTDKTKNVLDLSINDLRILVESMDYDSFKSLYEHFKCEIESFEKYYHDIYGIKEKVNLEFLLKDIARSHYFIEYCKENHIETIDDLKQIDFNDLNIRGLGKKSVYLIRNQIYKHLEDYKVSNNPIDNIFDNVNPANLNIGIKNLVFLGMPEEIISQYHLQDQQVKDLMNIQFSFDDKIRLQNIVKNLKIDIKDIFETKFNFAVKKRNRDIFLMRAEGHTLNYVGNAFDMTRERVRQIASKICTKMAPYTSLYIDSLIEDKEKGFELYKLDTLVEDSSMAMALKSIIKNTDQYFYMKFSDKIVDKDFIPDGFFESLESRLKTLAENGINIYELIDQISDLMDTQSFFTEDDLKAYILFNGGKIYGDLVSWGSISVGEICRDAISRYFNYDISLNDDENNPEMHQLRKILKDNYNFTYENGNRALTSAIVRDNKQMVLSGRSRYLPASKIDPDDYEVIKEIYEDLKQQDGTVYYNDLFNKYQSQLLTKTTIDNYNYLHGLLMYYDDGGEFTFTRDYMVKSGREPEKIDESFIAMIKEKHAPVTYDEVIAKFPSLNQTRIGFIQGRNQEIIYWGNKSWNVISNIKFKHENFKHILDLLILENKGYCSEGLLYDGIANSYPEFLERNDIIGNVSAVFHIIQYLYKDQYIMRYPHILSEKLSNIPANTFEITKYFVEEDGIIDLNLVNKLIAKLKWGARAHNNIFSSINNEYYQLSKTLFLKKDKLILSSQTIKEIETILDKKLECNDSYLPLISITNYEEFPAIGYEWTSFLLEGLIKQYMDQYKLIRTEVGDRRYQRSILLFANSDINEYDQLVGYVMDKDGGILYTENELLSLLKRHCLANKNIPQELYHSKVVHYLNELFTC